MARYDKYDPKDGGFRAPLNAAWNATSGPAGVSDLNRVIVVGLNANGRVVKATTAAAAVGVVVLAGAKNAGDIVDVMTDGEIVELGVDDIQGATAPTAGTKYYLDATASRLAATAPAVAANGFYIGTTVEAGRLVVRAATVQG